MDTLEELEQKQQELIEQQKEVSRLIKELKEKQQESWKPKYGEKYYYITDKGSISWTDWESYALDEYRHSIGNCFKCYDQAGQNLAYYDTKIELKNLAKELNADRTFDWREINQAKYYINYVPMYNDLVLQSVWSAMTIGQVYCLDSSFLDRAIERIGKERLIEMLKASINVQYIQTNTTREEFYTPTEAEVPVEEDSDKEKPYIIVDKVTNMAIPTLEFTNAFAARHYVERHQYNDDIGEVYWTTKELYNRKRQKK
jgi:hypothetical protein